MGARDEASKKIEAQSKEFRRKSIERMKNGWGETGVMKKRKKKAKSKQTAEADTENDSVNVSGIAKVLSRGPGSAYEA